MSVPKIEALAEALYKTAAVSRSDLAVPKIVAQVRMWVADEKAAAVASAVREKQREIARLGGERLRLEAALDRIARHDGGRWVWHDGVAERQAGPQEIARAALAGGDAR